MKLKVYGVGPGEFGIRIDGTDTVRHFNRGLSPYEVATVAS